LENTVPPRLILLSEFLDQSKRKEDEIHFEKELKKIEEKLYWLRREKNLTETIINIITQEKVVDIKEEMEKRYISEKEE